MDDRLKEVQTSDLNDSRLNHEFVDWLKTKGLNWLLAILLFTCAFLAWDLYKQRGQEAHDQAWVNLNTATMPQALASVAKDHADVGSISNLALMRAADTWMAGVINNTEPGATADVTEKISPERRTEMLDLADKTYGEVLANARTMPGFTGKPFAMAALFGQTAVAESRGDAEKAQSHLEEIVALSKAQYPAIAEQAETRMANLDRVTSLAALPSDAELEMVVVETSPYTPPITDGLLEIFEPEPEPDASAGPVLPTP